MGKKPRSLQETRDGISSLPDDVLTHTLSFLSTKDVVKTSVLSGRWKQLWTCVPTLDLSDIDFYPKNFTLDDVKQWRPEFLAFVYGFLQRKNYSGIQRIRLRCLRAYEEPLMRACAYSAKKNNAEELCVETYESEQTASSRLFMCLRKVRTLLPNDNDLCYTGTLRIATSDEATVESWMSVVTKFNTRELNLHVTYWIMRELPPSLPNGILVVLKLDFVLLNFPIVYAHFPNLKVLRLFSVRFGNEGLASNLFSSGCPMLEELEMHRTNIDNTRNLTITSKTLRRLIMSHSLEETPNIAVDAPNLQLLTIDGWRVGEYVFKEMCMLAEAKLRCRIENECLRQLLKRIPNVKHLHLTNKTMQVDGLPIFDNLTCLMISHQLWCNPIQWEVVETFLRNSPLLKDFIIINSVAISFEHDYELSPNYDVPSCLASKLETVRFFECQFNDMHLGFIKYILKNSKVLKKMEIHVMLDRERDKTEAAVLTFPKASAACFIDVKNLIHYF